MKKVLTIAGSDCSGGAGVQADLKTMAAHGVFGMSVIVSVVAENTARVIDIQDISTRMIEEQIDAVFEDIVPDAVKIGMLSSPECMKAVADKLRQYRPANVVIDPVMFAKNGDPLMDPKSVGALIETVLPFADVLTPNVPEAQYLAGMEIHTPADMETAARRIGALGCKNVLVKGGKNIPGAVDVLFDGGPAIVSRSSRSIVPRRTARAAHCPLPSRPTSLSAKTCPRQSASRRSMSPMQSVTRPVSDTAADRSTISAVFLTGVNQNESEKHP